MSEDVRTFIYLMRHGDIRHDEVKRYIGQTDRELTATGRTQALEWSRRLAGVSFHSILCSDLIRSQETAQIIADGRGSLIHSSSQFREIDLGDWDGREIEEIRSRHPEEFRERGLHLVHYRPPGGESFEDLSARVIPFFDEVIRAVSGNLLLIGHSGVNRVILCHIFGLSLQNFCRFDQDYGCLNVMEVRDQKIRLVAMNIPCSFSKTGE